MVHRNSISLSFIVLWPQNLNLSTNRMIHRHGQWACSMPTCRKKGFMWNKHTHIPYTYTCRPVERKFSCGTNTHIYHILTHFRTDWYHAQESDEARHLQSVSFGLGLLDLLLRLLQPPRRLLLSPARLFLGCGGGSLPPLDLDLARLWRVAERNNNNNKKWRKWIHLLGTYTWYEISYTLWDAKRNCEMWKCEIHARTENVQCGTWHIQQCESHQALHRWVFEENSCFVSFYFLSFFEYTM